MKGALKKAIEEKNPIHFVGVVDPIEKSLRSSSHFHKGSKTILQRKVENETQAIRH